MKEVSFREDIEALQSQLQRVRDELDELRRRRDSFNIETEETKKALEKLRQAVRGKLPERTIDAVDVNPESGRPSRGARKEQIEKICRRLGRGKREFRTAEVLDAMRKIEGELTDGMRSYTYAVMSTLEDEKFVEKVGRGRWVLG